MLKNTFSIHPLYIYRDLPPARSICQHMPVATSTRHLFAFSFMLLSEKNCFMFIFRESTAAVSIPCLEFTPPFGAVYATYAIVLFTYHVVRSFMPMNNMLQSQRFESRHENATPCHGMLSYSSNACCSFNVSQVSEGAIILFLKFAYYYDDVSRRVMRATTHTPE